MCKCINIDFATEENFAQRVLFDIPPHMESYKIARLKEGLSDNICIDPCIADEVAELWSKGITTYGSCCGHNKVQSFVGVDDKDIEKMLELGYDQYDDTKNNFFKLKSA